MTTAIATPQLECVSETRRVFIKALAIAAVVAAWGLATIVFYRGYVGSDDLAYARYAYLNHRLPINHWEYRALAIWAMRGNFRLFGPTEFAAALPTLLSSITVVAAVAWYVGWPARISWRTQGAVLLAATFPIDIAFRSIPGANYFSTGFLAIGTALLLKGTRSHAIVGAAALSLGFVVHEGTLWYIAILCLTALAFDRQRFWRPVLACVGFSGAAILIESLIHAALIGDPLIRFRTAALAATDLPFGYDPDMRIGGWRFWLWPLLENLVFSRAFGLYLVLAMLLGIWGWKALEKEQRILLVAVSLAWAWWSYGTSVPWVYKPFFRQIHMFGFVAFPVSVLFPTLLAHLYAERRRLAAALLGVALLAHVAVLAAQGHFGETVNVSRDLLQYARAHPDQTFLTDVRSLNHMYELNRFNLPGNVIALNGPASDESLLLNREPPGTPKFRFADRPVTGVLLNTEAVKQGTIEPEFLKWIATHSGERTPISPVKYRLGCLPLLPFMEPRGFMVRSYGGEAVQLPSPVTPRINE